MILFKFIIFYVIFNQLICKGALSHFYKTNLIIFEEFNYEFVTCGTVLKLLNSQHNVRLHSHDVKYGQGSGQQSVTAVESSDDHNSYWQIKERNGSNKTCIRGKAVKCGQTIRLMHLATGRYLHSHHFTSPLSHNLEVSAFGENGVGDEGDDWILQCSSGVMWSRNVYVSFRHSNTHAFLTVAGDRYGRPIEGQMEVSCVHTQTRSTEWISAEGVFVKPSVENNYYITGQSSPESHDEL